MSKVALIVLTYNSVSKLGSFFRKALGSFLNQDYDDYRIIFVDNASQDSTIELLRDICTNSRIDCKILRLPRNLGWSGGNNSGAVLAKNSKYLFFLNDYVVVAKDAVRKLVEFVEKNPDVGALQPIIINRDGSKFYGFDIGFSGIPSPATKPKDSPLSEAFYASGAALFTPAKVFFGVGMFPEGFFLYYDDVDYSWRVRLAGYKVGCLTTTWAYHYGSATLGERSPKFFYFDSRNRIWSIYANSSVLALLPRLYLNLLETTVAFILHYASIEKNPAIIKATLAGIIDGIRDLDKANKYRMISNQVKRVNELTITRSMNISVDSNIIVPKTLRKFLRI